VSEDVARIQYGVVVDAAGQVDEAGTQAQRSAIRVERIGGAPTKTASARGPVFTPIAVRNGHWMCAQCETDLGPQDGNWRDAAVTRESKITEKFDELHAQVRPAETQEPVVMRENFCPGCATALWVDVTLISRPLRPAPRLGVIDPYGPDES
jgi:N-methylhydantoinase B